MPFGSYHGAVTEGVANAIRFIKEAGAEAVKIEGPRVELVRALLEAEIPVIGHLGLTPQSIHRMGGYRVQARTADAIVHFKADALALAEAGAGALVLEGVPRGGRSRSPRSADSHDRHRRGAGLRRPDSGLPRSGRSDFRAAGQVRPPLRRGRRADPLRGRTYREDVERRAFPVDEESYHLPEDARRRPEDADKTGQMRLRQV